MLPKGTVDTLFFKTMETNMYTLLLKKMQKQKGLNEKRTTEQNTEILNIFSICYTCNGISMSVRKNPDAQFINMKLVYLNYIPENIEEDELRSIKLNK